MYQFEVHSRRSVHFDRFRTGFSRDAFEFAAKTAPKISMMRRNYSGRSNMLIYNKNENFLGLHKIHLEK